jgi:hypothetical protein
MLLSCLNSGGLAAADVDLESIQKEIETLKSRLEELERLVRTSQKKKEAQQDRDSITGTGDQTGPGVLTELEMPPVQAESANHAELTGALWLNYGYLSWDETNKDRDGNFDFTLFRLDANARHDDFLFSAQYRWYSYMDVIHHGWIGYEFSPQWQVQLGITQSPFGILPYASHSWWFGMPYYVGLEDDYDAGIKAIYSDGPWNAQFAFFKNDEYASGTRTKRFSFDVLHDQSGDCSLTDCNEETNQFMPGWPMTGVMEKTLIPSLACQVNGDNCTTGEQKTRETTGRTEHMPTDTTVPGTCNLRQFATGITLRILPVYPMTRLPMEPLLPRTR